MNDRICLMIGCGLIGLAAFAQSSSSRLLGRVTDSTGAIVTGAHVVATQTATNLSFETVTTAEGYYSISSLPVGPYRVEVEAKGFRKGTSALSHPLEADETQRIDFELSLGSVGESITVTAQAQDVDTSTATLRSVVDSSRMVELPLNGRDMIGLLMLTPGVVNTPSVGGGVQSAETGYSVGGGRGSTTNYLLDGGDNNDYFTGTPSFFPIPDAVQEFSVQSNNFSAEYGRAAGGVVNVITKSGANQLHGDLFEFLRNNALNTRNFFSLGTPKLVQNQFGGTFGAPLTIPRLYSGRNRTFIFLSYQATLVRSAPTISAVTVPTQLERNGDYSQSARKPNDPLTGKPFPDNLIPASRLDAVAQKFIGKFVPLPNLQNGQFSENGDVNTNVNQGLMRIDHSLSDTHKIYGRTFNQVQSETDADTVGLPYFSNFIQFKAWNLSVGDSWIARPNLVNSLTLTMDRTESLSGAGQQFRWSEIGSAVPLGGPASDPTAAILSVTGAFGFNQRVTLRLPRTVLHLNESVSYNKGSHFLRAGFEFHTVQEIRQTNNLLDGNFAFNGQFSGVPIADFLLGQPSSFTQSGSKGEGLPRFDILGFYVQDDWKVTRRLTVNLGIRLDPYFADVDQHHRSTFRAGEQSTVFPTAPAGAVFFGDPGVAPGIVPNQWNKLAPRVGLAWDVTGKGRTSVRAAYGIFYDNAETVQNQGMGNQPYGNTYTLVPPQSFANPYGSIQPVIPYYPPSATANRATVPFVLPATVSGLAAGFTTSYNQQRNLSVEQSLAANLKATIAYLGAEGTHLPIEMEGNPAVFGPGATVANTNARRIYAPNFTSIPLYTSTASSNYNALQATVNRRFAAGFTVLASYTWSKSIDNGSDSRPNLGNVSTQNPFNLRAERALSTFDAPSSFVGSSIWELPLFRKSGGMTGRILGGWQLSGILTLHSGLPFNVLSGVDNSLTGVGDDRPNLVGNPTLPGGRSRQAQITEYFNIAAFAQNAKGAFGNAGRDILRGPGMKNVDLALVKSFRIRESLKAQFRAEAFNALNNVNLANPASNLTSATDGRILSAGSSRVFQLAMKLQW